MKKYCCDTFKEICTDSENIVRGFSVFKKENRISFLRFSTVDYENEKQFMELLSSIKGKAAFNLSINGEIAILYCPWCGKKLNHDN